MYRVRWCLFKDQLVTFKEKYICFYHNRCIVLYDLKFASKDYGIVYMIYILRLILILAINEICYKVVTSIPGINESVL